MLAEELDLRIVIRKNIKALIDYLTTGLNLLQKYNLVCLLT